MAVLHVADDVAAEEHQVIEHRRHDHRRSNHDCENNSVTPYMIQCQQRQPANFHRQDEKEVHREVGIEPRKREEHGAIEKPVRRDLAGRAAGTPGDERHRHRRHVTEQQETSCSETCPSLLPASCPSGRTGTRRKTRRSRSSAVASNRNVISRHHSPASTLSGMNIDVFEHVGARAAPGGSSPRR